MIEINETTGDALANYWKDVQDNDPDCCQDRNFVPDFDALVMLAIDGARAGMGLK